MHHQFLAHLTHQRRLSEHTVAAYTNDLKQFSAWCLKDHEVSTTSGVTRDHVKGWLASLMTAKLAPSSIRRKLSSLKAFYAYQQSRELQRKNTTHDSLAPSPIHSPTTTSLCCGIIYCLPFFTNVACVGPN
jgi:integrase/recombinase XerC